MVVGKPAEVVRNAKGEIVGRIENGKVVDENGNVIGRVDKDGKPVGLDGSSLGSVEKVMLDNDGKLISGCSSTSSLKVFDLKTWECEHTIDTATGGTWNIAVCMQRLALACENAPFLKVLD